MFTAALDRIIEKLTFLGPLGEAVHQLLARLGAESAPGSGQVKDLLNGTWFGHPVHPAVIDLPIGAWAGAALLDLADGGQGKGMGRAADLMVAVGCVGAVAAAATGLADWQDKFGKERDLGTAHALVNSGALALFASSLALRLRGRRGAGLGLSVAGLAVVSTGAYLGGDMVYRMGMQVNRNAFATGPRKWTSVADESEVPEDSFLRKAVGKNQILLRRLNGEILAVGAVCSHAGGPLDELPLEDGQLHCPWHGSRFNLRSGQVCHGPATVANPVFDVRVQEGKVEVRRG